MLSIFAFVHELDKHVGAWLHGVGISIILIIAICTICWLLRDVIRWIVVKLLQVLAYQNKYTRQMEQQTREASISEIATLPSRYLTATLALALCETWVSPNLLPSLVTKVAITLTTIALALLLGRVINLLYLVRNHRVRLLGFVINEQLIPFAQSLVWIFIIFFTLILTLQQWGFDATALVAGTGLLGLALSLAAKDSAANLFGFFVIITERPFLVGDVIKSGDIMGTVEHVGWRSTRLRRQDQVVVSIPNSNVTAANILNWSRMTKQVIDFTLAIAASASPPQIETLLCDLRALLEARPLVEPGSPAVWLDKLGHGMLEIGVRCNILEAQWLKFTVE